MTAAHILAAVSSDEPQTGSLDIVLPGTLRSADAARPSQTYQEKLEAQRPFRESRYQQVFIMNAPSFTQLDIAIVSKFLLKKVCF